MRELLFKGIGGAAQEQPAQEMAIFLAGCQGAEAQRVSADGSHIASMTAVMMASNLQSAHTSCYMEGFQRVQKL